MDSIADGPLGPPAIEARRAYDAAAVDAYVASLRAEIASLRARLDEALEIAQRSEERVKVLDNAEVLLGRALLRSQRAGEQMIADARRKADLIVAEAQRRADDVAVDASAAAPAAGPPTEIDPALASMPPPDAGTWHAPQGVPAPAAAPGVVAGPWIRATPDERSQRASPPQAVAPDPDPSAHPPDSGVDRRAGRVVDLPLRPGAQNAGPARPSWDDPSDRGRPAADPRTESFPPDRGTARTGTDGGPLGWPASTPGADPAKSFLGEIEAGNELAARAVGDRNDPLANLRERWRLARLGAAALEDPFLSRSAQLKSIGDGSIMDPWEAETIDHAVRGEERQSRRWPMRRP